MKQTCSYHNKETKDRRPNDPSKARILKRNYHVTSQTAYHIAQLAIMEGTSEGRIIDKLMRTYLASMEI